MLTHLRPCAKWLHEEYMVRESVHYLVLVGDQKTYVRIQELKHEYGSELDWLIPFIGDWHLLSNYQSVLMKAYYDAGLKELAETSGHRGETLTSIKKCSSFKRIHQFLIQVWEAMYRQMFKSFTCVSSDNVSISQQQKPICWHVTMGVVKERLLTL